MKAINVVSEAQNIVKEYCQITGKDTACKQPIKDVIANIINKQCESPKGYDRKALMDFITSADMIGKSLFAALTNYNATLVGGDVKIPKEAPKPKETPKETKEQDKPVVITPIKESMPIVTTLSSNKEAVQALVEKILTASSTPSEVIAELGRRLGVVEGTINNLIEAVSKQKNATVETVIKINDVKFERKDRVVHKAFKQCIRVLMNKEPLYMYGPAGTGKNELLNDLVEALRLLFHVENKEEYQLYYCNSITQEFKVTGFVDAQGNYHETPFYKACKNGGLMCFDELDASIPEVLILLNCALANGYFVFENGEHVAIHPNTRFIACGNTLGRGADSQYSGRYQIDESTLNRFTPVLIDYDRDIELNVSNGDTELVDFAEAVRKNAKDRGISFVCSTRNIRSCKKYADPTDHDAMLFAVKNGFFKLLSNDYISTLISNISLTDNIYYKTAKEIVEKNL